MKLIDQGWKTTPPSHIDGYPVWAFVCLRQGAIVVLNREAEREDLPQWKVAEWRPEMGSEGVGRSKDKGSLLYALRSMVRWAEDHIEDAEEGTETSLEWAEDLRT